MDTLINFGKYKNQTYGYVIKNDIKYCQWILTTESKYVYIKEFKNFLKNNNIEERIYDISKLKHIVSINCSDLSEYMKYDEAVIDLIKNFNITTNKIDSQKTTKENNLPNNIFGIFIDYLIRYEICKHTRIEFDDDRADTVLSYLKDKEEAEDFRAERSTSFKKVLVKRSDGLVVQSWIKQADYYAESCFCKNVSVAQGEDIENSYNNMKQNKATIQDILNVSLCHSLSFNEMNALDYINHNNNVISNRMYENIIKWINIKVSNKDIILCNPIVGDATVGICGDADLIVDHELIDFKTNISNTIGNKITDFIQLFLYTSLYYKKTKKYINKITIFNPLYMIEYSITINDSIINKILDILTNYRIGSCRR